MTDDPFAMPSAPVAEASGPPCPSCGQPMDPARAAYDASGNLQCHRCAAVGLAAQSDATIQDQDPSTVRNLYLAAAGSLALSFGTCCMLAVGQFFFILALVPVGLGIATIARTVRNQSPTSMGAGYYAVIVMSVLGALFGLASFGLGILGMIGMGVSGARW